VAKPASWVDCRSKWVERCGEVSEREKSNAATGERVREIEGVRERVMGKEDMPGCYGVIWLSAQSNL